jgi:hypothetical protein
MPVPRRSERCDALKPPSELSFSSAPTPKAEDGLLRRGVTFAAMPRGSCQAQSTKIRVNRIWIYPESVNVSASSGGNPCTARRSFTNSVHSTSARYCSAPRAAKAVAWSICTVTIWPGCTHHFVNPATASSRVDMQSIHASMFRPYQDGKPKSPAKTSWNDAQSQIPLPSIWMVTQAARWRRPQRHALGPDRGDTRFRSRHRTPVSRIQATDCIDHKYAPSGPRSRTNAIPVVNNAEPGEWPLLNAPMIPSIDTHPRAGTRRGGSARAAESAATGRSTL